MGGYVYILANRRNGALYTGVTADLPRRIAEHRDGTGSAFARKWSMCLLVHVEHHDGIENAIVREKRIKKWNRAWKIALIEETNPDWRDLWFDINK